MSESDKLGPDQLFDQRAAQHQENVKDAEKKAQQAWEELGEVSPQVLEYANALERLSGLKADGKWLIAAQDTLGATDREALVRVRDTMDNKDKNQEE